MNKPFRFQYKDYKEFCEIYHCIYCGKEDKLDYYYETPEGHGFTYV